MHLRGAAFNRFTVVLHLVKRRWIAIAVNHFLAVFAARTGHDDFIGVNFDGALSHNHVASKRYHVALHIQGLLVRLNVNRLLGIAGDGKCRNAGGQK